MQRRRITRRIKNSIPEKCEQTVYKATFVANFCKKPFSGGKEITTDVFVLLTNIVNKKGKILRPTAKKCRFPEKEGLARLQKCPFASKKRRFLAMLHNFMPKSGQKFYIQREKFSCIPKKSMI